MGLIYKLDFVDEIVYFTEPGKEPVTRFIRYTYSIGRSFSDASYSGVSTDMDFLPIFPGNTPATLTSAVAISNIRQLNLHFTPESKCSLL